MFGYLKPNLKELPKDQKEIYRSVYCGLCHILKKKSKYIGITSLNYELTALLILALSLKTRQIKIFHGTCSITPFLRVPYLDYYCEEFEIAADLSIYIVNHKINDNIMDEGKTRWKLVSTLYKKKMERAKRRLEICAESIDASLKNYYDLEKSNNPEFESLLNANGAILQNILYPMLLNIEIEGNAKVALVVAHLVGKWIYLIDACDDYYNDLKNNEFNPINLLADKSTVPDMINEIAYLIQTEIQNLTVCNMDYLMHHLFIEIISETSMNIIKKFEEKEIENGNIFYN